MPCIFEGHGSDAAIAEPTAGPCRKKSICACRIDPPECGPADQGTQSADVDVGDETGIVIVLSVCRVTKTRLTPPITVRCRTTHSYRLNPVPAGEIHTKDRSKRVSPPWKWHPEHYHARSRHDLNNAFSRVFCSSSSANALTVVATSSGHSVAGHQNAASLNLT